jgi:uncharacterized protein YjbI with pentapeptide repeats
MTNALPPPEASIISAQDEVTQLHQRLEAMEETTQARFVRGEHRLVALLENLIKHTFLCFRRKQHFLPEAMTALVVYFFSPKTLIVTGLSIGGIFAFFLALEANELATINNELSEGNRRAASNIELTNILDLVHNETKPYFDACQDKTTDKDQQKRVIQEAGGCIVKDETVLSEDGERENISCQAGQENCVPKSPPLPTTLVARIAGLTQALRPYRFLQDKADDNKNCSDSTDKRTLFARVTSWGKYLWEFQKTPRITCQGLSPRLSPERGQILLALVNAGIDIQENYTFERAFLPNALLMDATLPKITLSEADLSGSNLSRTNLQKANLARANLLNAGLWHTDLTEAYILYAYLAYSNLAQAILVRANLSYSDLSFAGLEDADLRDAALQESNLTQADLARTKLTQANLYKTNFSMALLWKTSLHRAVNLNADQLRKACIESETLQELLPIYPDLKTYVAPKECNKRWKWEYEAITFGFPPASQLSKSPTPKKSTP